MSVSGSRSFANAVRRAASQVEAPERRVPGRGAGRAASQVEAPERHASARPRRDRQEVQVVCLAIAGESDRACGLASVHLGEFPHDDLVRRVRKALA